MSAKPAKSFVTRRRKTSLAKNAAPVASQRYSVDEGIKRLVVDVAAAVHRQVKVKSIHFPGGIKEYILRLLETDGIDLSSQPDFVSKRRDVGGR